MDHSPIPPYGPAWGFLVPSGSLWNTTANSGVISSLFASVSLPLPPYGLERGFLMPNFWITLEQHSPLLGCNCKESYWITLTLSITPVPSHSPSSSSLHLIPLPSPSLSAPPTPFPIPQQFLQRHIPPSNPSSSSAFPLLLRSFHSPQFNLASSNLSQCPTLPPTIV